MQVEVKKVKLTVSLLNQVITSVNLSSFEGFTPLGWVLTNKGRFHVFFKDGLLIKMTYNTSFKINDFDKQINDEGDIKHIYKVRIYVNTSINYIEFETESEANEYVLKYQKLIDSSLDKGQFYL